MSAKLVKIGSTDVQNARGFFWDGCHEMSVAATDEDVKKFPGRELRNMDELVSCYAVACSLRSIVWCDKRVIAARGVCAITFTFSDKSSRVIYNTSMDKIMKLRRE